jgi:hypothetical protein
MRQKRRRSWRGEPAARKKAKAKRQKRQERVRESSCVIAMVLDDAERMLREEGVTAVDVIRTQPPRGGPAGPLRVVRQRQTHDGVELMVSPSAPLPEREKSHD